MILEAAFGKFTTSSHFSYYLGSCGAFFTAFYSTRLLFLTFLSKPNGFRSVICYAYDSSYFICISLGVLAIPSIFIGFFSRDMPFDLAFSTFSMPFFGLGWKCSKLILAQKWYPLLEASINLLPLRSCILFSNAKHATKELYIFRNEIGLHKLLHGK